MCDSLCLSTPLLPAIAVSVQQLILHSGNKQSPPHFETAPPNLSMKLLADLLPSRMWPAQVLQGEPTDGRWDPPVQAPEHPATCLGSSE